MKKLFEKGIETRTFFYPMHQQPVLRRMGFFRNEQYPIAEDIAQKGCYLPSGSGLKRKEIEFICSAIKEIQRKSSIQ